MNFLAWPFKLLKFSVFYSGELVSSNLRVAKDILRGRSHYSDVVGEFDVQLNTSLQIVILLTLITMTPGTVSLAYDVDRSILTVHFMYDDEAVGFEDKIRSKYIPFIRTLY
jgi:multicomponent Na+:H+ antiporter subunit E